jgi:hypothetical protein
MNSWNNQTAPAYNMKIYNLGFSRDVQNKLYDLLCCENAYDVINMIVEDFDAAMRDYGYSAGFNGRSGGYLVLYKNGTCAGFEAKDVPGPVLRAFRRLALDIRAQAKYMAEHCEVAEEPVTVTTHHKVIKGLDQ